MQFYLISTEPYWSDRVQLKTLLNLLHTYIHFTTILQKIQVAKTPGSKEKRPVPKNRAHILNFAFLERMQEFDGAFDIAKECQHGQYKKGEYRQGNKLGYAGNYKGQTTAEEHIVTGQAQKSVNSLTVDSVDNTADGDPAKIP